MTIAKFMNEEYPGVPFIWIDDETTEADSKYLEENCPVRSKIFTISPRIGLTDKDFEEIKAYKDELTNWEA